MILVTPSISTGNTVAGFLVGNTPDLSGMLGQVLVKPPNSAVTYDVTIANNKGSVVFQRTSHTDAMFEEVYIPVRGIYFIVIKNSTLDGPFTIQLMIRNQ